MLRLQQFVRPLSQQIRSFASVTSPRFSSADNNDEGKDKNHPVARTLGILKNDMQKVTNFLKSAATNLSQNSSESPEKSDNISEKLKKFNGTSAGASDDEFQTHCDVVVIGGGGVGSSVAYWLKEKARDGLNVIVVEKDPTVILIFIIIIQLFIK